MENGPFQTINNGFSIEALLIKAMLYSDKWHDLETAT